MHELTRRQLVRSGLALGAFFVFAGCESSSRRTRVRTGSAYTPNSADWEFKSRKPKWLDGADLSGAAATPGVVARASWTSARPNLPDTNPMNGISRITVHHDGMNAFTSTSQAAAAQRLESIRRSHVSANGWADIGYHYVIDPAGRVWEARPVNLQGAHVKDNNEHNLGVMVMGNYDQQSPTGASTKALDDFVSAMMRKYRVPVSRVYTHQEIRPTACPGRSLQYVMESTRSRGGSLARA
ncbi:MAG TPA: peptidoglycan recognition family protein [Phycisphaerales bacterium]|nr:peptidoglycan recognition family protein [Phycisphaerales bacterium]